jgi:hypothetical protein
MDRQNIPYYCSVLSQVRISQQICHKILHNQTLNRYFSIISRFSSIYTVLCSHKITHYFLKTDEQGSSESSENVHRTTRCYVTQNTNLIIPKINKHHFGEFCRHRLQLCVSLSAMVGKKPPWICSFRKRVR